MILKSTRDAYGEGLVEIGSNNNIVVLDADLSSSTQTYKFAEKYPERFFNVGCAEQDLIATASGFAYAGKIAIASTYAIFASGRAWEIIRSIIAHDNLNVKIIVSHSGITNSADGASHQSLEDIALMRVIPNMKVVVPVDAVETVEAVKTAVKEKGPFYIRLNRTKTPVIFGQGFKFGLGKGNLLREGDDVAIISTGTMVSKALEACEILKNKGIDADLINISSIKPIDKNLILSSAKKTGAIVTVEEHNIYGGLGGAIAEVTAGSYPVPIEFVGVNDQFGQTGSIEELYKIYGLTPDNIADAAQKVLLRKK